MNSQPLPTLAMIGTYPPRRCGIATFTADLRAALVDGTRPERDGGPLVVALDHGRRDPRTYPPEVVHRLHRGDRQAYRELGARLQQAGVEVVSLQHEYGIFGGPSGRDVLELLDGLPMPVITTLHTVLRNPRPLQRSILDGLMSRSARVVVMSELARRRVRSEYGVDKDKLVVIPHGVPEILPIDPGTARRRLGLSPHEPLLLSFGLLGPGKRLERVIAALGRVKGRAPLPRFVILGATHPEVLRRHGERYRTSLVELSRDLGVSDQVTFVDRYVDADELTAWLQASDMFVTAYGNAEQVASGTLALAAAAGCACISTPYEHARALLSEGRGVLVPFDGVDALAQPLADLLADPDQRRRLGERARAYAASMTWPRVGAQYAALVSEVAPLPLPRRERPSVQPLAAPRLRAIDARPSRAPLAGIARRHLERLSAGGGVMQHAVGLDPDPRHGRCTDDVARALIVDLLQQRHEPGPTIAIAMRRSMTFLEDAFNPEVGRFRNFCSADGQWLESIGSEDSHGRAMQGLGAVLGQARDAGLVARAARLLEAALPAALAFRGLRPRCYATLGCASALRRLDLPGAAEALANLAGGLAREAAATSEDWPWPEPVVTYDNGSLPQALITAGEVLARPEWTELGIAQIEWLLAAQLSKSGTLTPIGNHGWWPRGASPARYDQQPIEAASLLEAAREAFEATGDERFADAMERCYNWFLGGNDLGEPLADPTTGACRDGLGPITRNGNCGAESTLAWLLAVERIRELRAGRAERVREREAVLAGRAG